ncbi:hypothetical protein HS3_03584 [Bacillus subtilis]|nr:hypothetical protein HS3_03584 [Bacillus subtilis]
MMINHCTFYLFSQKISQLFSQYFLLSYPSLFVFSYNEFFLTIDD